MVTLGLFITTFEHDPLYFVSVVFTVVISITLHELAHGWMAIRRGDDTPIRLGRMTVNPWVHMGLWSFVALAIAGIAWGRMPIDHTRIRGKHGEAWVALAGPAMNLLLSIVALTGLGMAMRYEPRLGMAPTETEHILPNVGKFVRVFGFVNVLLCVFNLLPVPPLDGSHLLASFSRGYARFISNPSNQGAMLFMFIGAFFFASVLFEPAFQAARWYLGLLSGY